MSGRRRATLFEDLPEEIVVDQILIRLPPKDVGRCRAVSTSWRTATSMPEFMLEHHRRQPSLPIFDGRGAPASFVIFGNASAGSSSQQLWPFLRGLIDHYETRLYGACDGLLLVYRGSRFYICNPVIRKHALLPQPQVGQTCLNHIIGFYRFHPTGEYRVLWVSQKYSICRVYVLTVGSEEPRHVTVTMPAVSSPSVEQKLLKELRSSSYSLGDIFDSSRRNVLSQLGLNGSLHWCPKRASDITGAGGDIIVFDTEAESFRWMGSPAQLCSNKKLFNMKGMLAFSAGSTPSFTAMDVWVMQDYEAEIWTLKYRIDVSINIGGIKATSFSFFHK
uniref:Uncharacterized protein n=1 Tax=Avena sativa TaxID=4498 RepID=A0ACD5UJS6_AVESA